MRKQLWMIAKVWAYRPMMWLLAIVVCIALFASIDGRNRTVLRSAFIFPGEYGGPVTLTMMSILKDGEEFQQSAQSGEVDRSVEGIDLKSMDLRDPSNALEDLARLEHGLANYPSVRWIRFGVNQIQHVSNDTFSRLPDLATIIIHDDQITQADVDRLAGITGLQILALETLDFPASLKTLAKLPALDTLVLSHGTYTMVDSPMKSLFRPDVLSHTHELVHLRRLVLMPQWLPGEAYFAGSKTPDPACDPILKENAAKLLPGHPALTDVWLGVARSERSGRDLAAVRAAMPDVNVRSAQYNENSVSRVGFGALAIVLLPWVCMYNLSGHFSTPQRRVIPNYARPHKRFVIGFAVLAVIVSTVAIHTPVAVAWLPALAVSSLAVALAATLMASTTILNLRRPGLVWVPSVIMVALMWFALIRPVLRQAIPAMEPAIDQFLCGHYPVLAIVMAVACLPAISWMIRQFTDNDRLNAEAGLPPIITVEDIGKQMEILGLRRRGSAGQRALDAWNSQLDTLKSRPGGWLRDIRLDWMGEPAMPFVRWVGILVAATVIAFVVSRFSFRGWEFAAMNVCAMAVAATLMIPMIPSLARRDVLPLELLFPNSRAQFVRRRTLSIATKYSYLFAGLFVSVVIVRHFCFHALNLEDTMRAGIVFVPATIAGTGLVLWGSSIRNVFAAGLLVVVVLVIVMFAAFSCLDFRWIDDGKRGEQIHAFVTSPLFYAVSFAAAGLLLWTGYSRLSHCELSRQ